MLKERLRLSNAAHKQDNLAYKTKLYTHTHDRYVQIQTDLRFIHHLSRLLIRISSPIVTFLKTFQILTLPTSKQLARSRDEENSCDGRK